MRMFPAHGMWLHQCLLCTLLGCWCSEAKIDPMRRMSKNRGVKNTWGLVCSGCLDSHAQNVSRQICVQYFFVLSYLDKCSPPKSCGPTLTNHVKRRNPIYVCICTKRWLLLNKAHWRSHWMLKCQQTKCNAKFITYCIDVFSEASNKKQMKRQVNSGNPIRCLLL